MPPSTLHTLFIPGFVKDFARVCLWDHQTRRERTTSENNRHVAGAIIRFLLFSIVSGRSYALISGQRDIILRIMFITRLADGVGRLSDSFIIFFCCGHFLLMKLRMLGFCDVDAIINHKSGREAWVVIMGH